MCECFHVETAASNHHRQLAALVNIMNRPHGRTAELFDIHLLGQWHRPEQMVGRPGQNSRFWFRGQQIETAINLKGVSANDLGVQTGGYLGRDLGFSRGGGADDEERSVHNR